MARSVSLDPFAGQHLRIRFWYANGGGGYSQTNDLTGWFVDQIAVVAPGGVTVLSEGAEEGLTRVTAQVPSGYKLLSDTVYQTRQRTPFI